MKVEPVAGGVSLCCRNWCRLARLSKLFQTDFGFEQQTGYHLLEVSDAINCESKVKFLHFYRVDVGTSQNLDTKLKP
ncbi:MAG: hypothetical protein V7K41_21520 [Nostoc sp.]